MPTKSGGHGTRLARWKRPATSRLLLHLLRFVPGDPFLRVFLERRLAAGTADPVRLPLVTHGDRAEALRDHAGLVAVFGRTDREICSFALRVDGVDPRERTGAALAADLHQIAV